MTGYNRDTTSTTDDPRPRPGGLETTAESAQPSGGPPSGPLFHAEELVAGRYRVRRFLGQGAVGEVYAVHDLQLGADVALKALKPGAPSTSPSIERFKREILLARRVSHPNVCRIFDLGVHLLERPGVATEPVLFLTMELLDGRTLVRRIEEGGPYAEAEAVPVIRQLAEGLAAAHRAGVVHRDFKSSNVVLVPGPAGERAVITDFGLAREQDVPSGSGLTATGGVLGTPAYMAPEQVEGRRATPRSDLYAFGVVIYEMMSGELPFEGESPLSVAVQRLQHDPIPLESRRSGLSHRMRAIVRRLLERDADDRFAEALEVSRALEGEVPAASPRRRRRRRRLLAPGWAWDASRRVLERRQRTRSAAPSPCSPCATPPAAPTWPGSRRRSPRCSRPSWAPATSCARCRAKRSPARSRISR
jgi:serine/threonine protein kinase